MKKLLVLVSLIALSFVFSGITYAAQATGILDVNVNVLVVCTVTTQPVEFGNMVGDTQTTGTGDVTVNCPEFHQYWIALDAGSNYDGEFRNVASGSYQVAYLLGSNPSMGIQWGDHDFANTYPDGNSLAGNGTGSDQSHTVYGLLSAFTGIPAGTTLTDAVTVTVHY